MWDRHKSVKWHEWSAFLGASLSSSSILIILMYIIGGFMGIVIKTCDKEINDKRTVWVKPHKQSKIILFCNKIVMKRDIEALLNLGIDDIYHDEVHVTYIVTSLWHDHQLMQWYF